MISVAITDDHTLIITGIQGLLKNYADIQLDGAYLTAEDTRKGLKHTPVDVLLLDLNLPDKDGLALCKELKIEYPRLKIIILTTYNQSAFVRQAIKNGALGYLLKNISSNELYLALNTVVKGEDYIQQEVKEMLVRESLGKKVSAGFLPTLTRREKEILKLIVDEFKTQEIAEKLFVSVKTIETHRTHLMEKLEVRNVAGLVKIALEKNLI